MTTFQLIQFKANMFNVPVSWAVQARKDHIKSEVHRLSLDLIELYDIPKHEQHLATEIIEAKEKKKNRYIQEYYTLEKDLQRISEPSNVQDLETLRLKARSYPIEDMITSQNVKKGANRHIYYSPLRQEKTPSFVVYVQSNTAFDFGVGESYDSISLFMALNNVDFVTAIKTLGKM